MDHIFLLIRFRYFLLDAGHVVNTRLLLFTDLIVEFTDFVVFLCRASIFCFGGQLSYLWISLTCLRLLIGFRSSGSTCLLLDHAVSLGTVSTFWGMQELNRSAVSGGCERRALLMRSLTEDTTENLKN